MSVIINDMEMPKTCDDCNLESYCNLWVKVNGGRHPDCPLSEQTEYNDTRKIGRWIETDSCMTVCSECHGIGCGTRYCPNCGAKMLDEIKVGDEVASYSNPEDIYVVLNEFQNICAETMVTLLRRSDGDIDTYHLYHDGRQQFEKTGNYFEDVPELIDMLVTGDG